MADGVSGIDVGVASEEQWSSFVRTTMTAFGNHPPAEELDPANRTFPLERSVLATEKGRAVGTAGAFPFEMTLPGATSEQVAAVTWVSVLPTHRRRGVLTSMMRHQLDDVHERGESLAVLLASESVIYGRFGYGWATTGSEYELPRHRRALAVDLQAANRVRFADVDEAKKVLPSLHEQARRQQPGDLSRTEGWWNMFWRNTKAGGRRSARFYVLVEGRGGKPEGYAAYRVGENSAGFGTAAVIVEELRAITTDAYVALWSFVTDIDLTERVTTSMRSIDEPIRHLLRDPRQLRSTNVSDVLWVRTVDIGRAMATRRYPFAGRFVLEVHDRFCEWNDGRWVVEGGPDGASCKRVKTRPDVVLGAADLGAIYLGGTRLSTLVATGRATARSASAAAAADAFFAAESTPVCFTHF